MAKNGKVRIGMIAEQCEMAWGKPERINYTRNKHGTHEQWCYANGSYLYLENDVLVSIAKSK